MTNRCSGCRVAAVDLFWIPLGAGAHGLGSAARSMKPSRHADNDENVAGCTTRRWKCRPQKGATSLNRHRFRTRMEKLAASSPKARWE